MPSAFIIKLILASWILQAILKVRHVYFCVRQINVSFWQVFAIRQCSLVPQNAKPHVSIKSIITINSWLANKFNLFFIGTTFTTKGHYLDEIKRQSSPMVIPLFNGRRSLSERNPRWSITSLKEAWNLQLNGYDFGNAPWQRQKSMLEVLFTCQHFRYCNPRSFATGVLWHKKRWISNFWI